MGVFQNDCVKDAALNELATADLLSLCEDQPTTYADATTAKGSGGKKLGLHRPHRAATSPSPTATRAAASRRWPRRLTSRSGPRATGTTSP